MLYGRVGRAPILVTLHVHAQTEFCLALIGNIVTDLCMWFPDYSSMLSIDFDVIKRRSQCEGFSFLSKTLPLLGKAIEQGIENGSFDAPREFKTHGKTRLCNLLGCLLRELFDERGKTHVTARSTRSLRGLRQIAYCAYRLEVASSESDKETVINRFRLTEEELASASTTPWWPVTNTAIQLAEYLLHGFKPLDILPRHGPGAVATGERGDDKFTFSRLYNRIHQAYPYYDYYIVGGSKELVDRISWYKKLTRIESGVAKVILVPKDSRGPRLISEEPLEYQWIQQGLGRKLMRHLELKTQGHIMFSDQSQNGRLALESSSSGANATIDMKDASDRVSCRLVETLVPKGIYRYLWAARSSHTKLPDGEVLALNKFAPMGSALCFPVEAFCFYCLAVSAISVEFDVNLQTASQLVYVYGDDIIVPSYTYMAVTSAFLSWQLKVNHDKSFWRGSFRESCGIDAFQGSDVTPVKPRTLWSGRREDGEALASWVAYANGFKRKGYHVTFEFIKSLVERVYGKIPYGLSSSGGICWIVDTYSDAIYLNKEQGIRMRLHPRYQSVQVFSYTLMGCKKKTGLDGWRRLLRNICCGAGDEPDFTALNHATMRIRWFSI